MEFPNVPPDCIPDLMKFVRTASIAQNIDSLRSDTLPMMRRIFRSDSTIIWLIDENNKIADPLEMNVPQRFFPMYRDYYFRKNPFDPVNMQSFAGTSASMEQVVPFNEFKKSEYYNDFIRPQKIQRQMVVYIRVNNRLKSIVCTHRFKNRKFNQEDLNAGDIVSLHLSSAFERIHMIDAIKSRGSFLQMILNSTDVGIVALDLGKKPLFINQKAVSICEEIKKEPISEHERYKIESLIPSPVLNDCEAVKNCRKKDLKAGRDSFPMRERSMLISSFEKCRFRCRMVNSDLTDFKHPLILVFMEVLPLHPKINDQAVEKNCRLTKRETEITSYIIRGYKNAEIAKRLYISEGTVKNHLRNIFKKVKVNTRTGLIHKILSL
jgi:DNA-binding CsgD family transcriptional regulator